MKNKLQTEYRKEVELKTTFVSIVMELIGTEITYLDAFVYADKYLKYFGVSDMESYIRYYNKAMKDNKVLPYDIELNLMHDLMLTRDSRPEYCVPRTSYTI